MRQLALLVMVTVLCLGACSGDDEAPPADAPQAAPDAPPVVPDADPNACAAPGAVGNELGVGEYCTDGNGECSDNMGVGPDGPALFCTADFGETPSFCTKPCMTTAQCGADATCRGEGTVDGGSMGCVPNCIL